jgi:hypothetical protein
VGPPWPARSQSGQCVASVCDVMGLAGPKSHRPDVKSHGKPQTWALKEVPGPAMPREGGCWVVNRKLGPRDV